MESTKPRSRESRRSHLPDDPIVPVDELEEFIAGLPDDSPLSWRYPHRIVPKDRDGSTLFDSTLAAPWKPRILSRWNPQEYAVLVDEAGWEVLNGFRFCFPGHSIEYPWFPSLVHRIDSLAGRWVSAVLDRPSELALRKAYQQAAKILRCLDGVDAAYPVLDRLCQSYRARRDLSPFAGGSRDASAAVSAALDKVAVAIREARESVGWFQGVISREAVVYASGGVCLAPLPTMPSTLARRPRGAPESRSPFGLFVAFQVDELIERFGVIREEALRYVAKRYDRVWKRYDRVLTPADRLRLWGRRLHKERDPLERIDVLAQRLSKVYDRAHADLSELEAVGVGLLRQKSATA